MVIDIDMTDYDDVRTCCKDKGICHQCWRFIVIAVKIIHRVLQEDFGFQNCLWVFSGRRGVHCWIADDRARKMDMNARKALICYLELIKVTLIPLLYSYPMVCLGRRRTEEKSSSDGRYFASHDI